MKRQSIKEKRTAKKVAKLAGESGRIGLLHPPTCIETKNFLVRLAERYSKDKFAVAAKELSVVGAQMEPNARYVQLKQTKI